MSGNSTYKTTLNAALLTGYNPSVHPGQNYDRQLLNINVSFSLTKIQTFDELASAFTITGVFKVTWHDERLKWTPDTYYKLTNTHFKQKEIWTPPFVLSNSYHNIDLIGNGDMPVKLTHDGTVDWFLPLKLSSSCDADVTYYPNDEQICNLEILPWGYTQKHIKVTVPSSSLNPDEYEQNPTWTLVSISQYSYKAPKLGFGIIITLRRKPLFFIVNFIMPTVFVSFINMMVFLLPAESGERVGFSITVLLAIAVFLSTITTILPQTSTPQMALLCYLLVAQIGQSLLIMLCTIFGLRFYLRPTKEPVPRWIARLTSLASACKNPSNSNVHPLPENTVTVLSNEEPGDVCKDADNNVPDFVVSWQLVGKSFDSACCVFFLLTSIICNTAFLVVMCA
ncbi:acetylcholine receptor subunit beta-type unc-29-like [Pecten maximus]|uniref:acetylcholine receptor subunit beta-type unc-29-like n=1 Tax=Pecten maximus TaxID=6579 RepID=UPI001457FFB1|nr:acetylcholine receptor subunit beta-type unc-29-like [Pecten maximus]